METKIWDDALNGLNIKHHKHILASGIFYFCRLHNGLSFDIKINPDGTVRLWRFVCQNVPHNRTGVEFAYTDSAYPDIVFGFEVTNEYDLCFYAELNMDREETDTAQSIAEQLSIFLHLITKVNLRYKKQGLFDL